MIDRQSILDTFIDLCRIYSPSLREAPIARYIIDRLASYGIEAETDGSAVEIGGTCGNVIATIEGKDGDAPALMLAAHMDTVEPAEGVEPLVDGDIVMSAGDTVLGADDKVGVTALLAVARSLAAERSNRGRVVLVFTVAEEKGLHGAKAFDLAALDVDLAVTLDADGPIGTVDTRSPYHESVRAELVGRAAHAGVQPEQGVNAIQAAAIGIARMKLGRLDSETTANVGKIEGGRASNIVPDSVRVVAEARSADLSKLQAQVADMKQAFEEGAREVGAELRLEINRDFDGYHHKMDDPGVALLRRAMENLGIKPRWATSGGGSDANIFNSKGVPTINIGIGAGKVHTTNEYVSATSIVDLTKLTLEVVKLIGE